MMETLHHALNLKLITEEAFETRDPSLIIGLPRLSLITGLLHLDPNEEEGSMSLINLFPEESSILQQLKGILDTFKEDVLLRFQRMLVDDSETMTASEVDPNNAVAIQEFFIQICRIADELQSGPHARYFVEVLGQVFSSYS